MSEKPEPAKTEISTIFGRCRCCLEYGYMKKMWDEHYEMGECEIYGEMLLETFSIAWDISTDSKTYICELCVVRLRDAFNFKKEVLASDKLLQDDSDNEFQTEEEKSDIWYDYKEDKEQKSVDNQELEYEEERLEEEGLEDESDSQQDTEEYEEVEYLDEYATEVAGNSASSSKKTGGGKWPRKKRSHKVTRPYKNYSVDDMRSALEAVTGGEMSILEASKKYGVPRKTIAAKVLSLKNNTSGKEPDVIATLAREQLNLKRYRYLGGDEVYKHKENVQSIIAWSNATPIKGHDKSGFGCCFCKQTFKLATQLKQHTRSVHKSTLAALHTKHTLQWILRMDMTELKCKICNEDTRKIEELLEHLKSHDKPVHTDIKNQIIPYSFPDNKLQCIVCTKSFELFLPLTTHTISHYKVCECPECGRGFISRKTLSRHLIRHERELFKCKFCGKNFKNRERAMVHERLKHKLGDRRRELPPSTFLKCDVCLKKFTTSLQLSQHMSMIHLRVRRFVCEHVGCDKGFYLKKDLEDHVLTHTKEKRFVCTLCPKMYTRRRALVEHLRVHAVDTRYVCDFCGQKYVRAQSLRYHLLRKHGGLSV